MANTATNTPVLGYSMDTQTHDRLASMERRLDDGQKTFGAVRADVSDIKVGLAELKTMAVRAAQDHKELRDWSIGHEERLSALEKSDAKRIGERGVWAAILESPVVAWLVAAGAGAWAFFAHSGSAAK